MKAGVYKGSIITGYQECGARISEETERIKHDFLMHLALENRMRYLG